jgi:mRNA degradation ribonuclease J1/J2
MSKLRFYGGVDEIGGNEILIEEKDTKIFFDFGQSFGITVTVEAEKP